MTHTRRDALVALSAVATTALVGCDPACAGRTGSQTEGPYYPGEPEARAAIAEDRVGVPVTIELTVVARGDCTPLADAEVDLWGADADGAYSSTEDFGTEGEGWQRGQQVTDADGRVTFTAIVPGSYPGRAVHLHVKVRVAGRSELTTQVYLPDEVAAAVLAEPTYAGSAAQTLNADDRFYDDDTLLAVAAVEGTVAAGLSVSGTLIV